MERKLDKKLIRKIIIGVFVSVPVLSSLISTIHIVDFFNLGNYGWMSYILAAAFELGSIASFIVLSVLEDIKRYLLWTVFFLLSFLQIVGNVFFSFNYVFVKLQTIPTWLNSFNALMNYFTGNDIEFNKILLACLIGVPVPLISLFFLKSLADYLKLDKIEEQLQQPQASEEKERLKVEYDQRHSKENKFEKIEKRLDEALESETKESLDEFLEEEKVKEQENQNENESIEEFMNVAVMQNNNVK